MNQNSSGALGFFSLIAVFTLLFVLRSHVPSLANLLLMIVGIGVLILILFVSVVMFFALRKPKASENQKFPDEVNKILVNGRQNLIKLRSLSLDIKDKHICTLNNEICDIIERIFQTIKEQPEQINSLRQFFHYYLPTLKKILVKYKELETRGLSSSEIKKSTNTCLEDIKIAMEKQYHNLFEDDILDLTVEMEVLKQMCKHDGLLTEADFSTDKGI